MDDTTPNPDPEPILYACPHCGQDVSAPPQPDAPFITCPHCFTEFVIPSQIAPEDEPQEEASESDDDDLSGLRIRAVTKLRRAAIRNRSYLIILTSICLVGIVQLGINIFRHLRHGDWGRKPLGYALFIILLVILAVHFVRRALAYHWEIRQSALTEPDAAPDFSSLSDGSQHWKNLEKFAQDTPPDSPPSQTS